ncbi:hypothetical protein BJ684DRAFT_21795 [Piptocephalis cylindrospora]|uniref:Uncharacterized protein n=1 Tax=Piptocephalis cylindrospora TaxID=1907219 RepID=A0A4P9XYZ1_9FUNG|nr:hypothetical protein BJ684DRAFT_21795 [Piptocephalis cylindrospora]|eukprot:RKP11627.1 hypothetical protein BJ684DRAFT_21795 [Piptocephalis cylindrospora]
MASSVLSLLPGLALVVAGVPVVLAKGGRRGGSFGSGGSGTCGETCYVPIIAVVLVLLLLTMTHWLRKKSRQRILLQKVNPYPNNNTTTPIGAPPSGVVYQDPALMAAQNGQTMATHTSSNPMYQAPTPQYYTPPGGYPTPQGYPAPQGYPVSQPGAYPISQPGTYPDPQPGSYAAPYPTQSVPVTSYPAAMPDPAAHTPSAHHPPTVQ